jgi:1,4-dihydroxy-6-naphthoate synthase
VVVLSVGLSTCPNDTFLFAPLLQGRVDTRGLDLSFTLADVQELNEALAAGSLHVSKASFAAALDLWETWGVLPVGSALGFGVGPVLLGRPGGPPLSELESLASEPGAPPVLCPGAGTTATLLLAALHPTLRDVRHLRFDQIMPTLEAGEADAGVCIHEGRFTYADSGLTLLEDLGARWEQETGAPVPLGGLLARLELGEDVHRRLAAVLADSLAAARADPAATLPTMREHAQELDDDVIWQHVRLYVNDHTADLGQVGAEALAELATRSGRGRAPRILGS